MLLRDGQVRLGVRHLSPTNVGWTNTESADCTDPESAAALAADLQYRSVTVENLDGAAILYLLLKEGAAEAITAAIPILPRATMSIDFEAFRIQSSTGIGATFVGLQSSAAASDAAIIAEFVP